MSNTKLKALQVRLNKLKESIDTSQSEIKVMTDSLNKLKSQRGNLEAEIKSLTTSTKNLIVSEHAILRYLERVMEYDLSLIEQAILSESLKASYKTFGNGNYPVSDGVKAVVKDGVVVSILD